MRWWPAGRYAWGDDLFTQMYDRRRVLRLGCLNDMVIVCHPADGGVKFSAFKGG